MGVDTFVAVPAHLEVRAYTCSNCGNAFLLFASWSIGTLMRSVQGDAARWPNELSWACDACVTMKRVTSLLSAKRAPSDGEERP